MFFPSWTYVIEFPISGTGTSWMSRETTASSEVFITCTVEVLLFCCFVVK